MLLRGEYRFIVHHHDGDLPLPQSPKHLLDVLGPLIGKLHLGNAVVQTLDIILAVAAEMIGHLQRGIFPVCQIGCHHGQAGHGTAAGGHGSVAEFHIRVVRLVIQRHLIIARLFLRRLFRFRRDSLRFGRNRLRFHRGSFLPHQSGSLRLFRDKNRLRFFVCQQQSHAQ